LLILLRGGGPDGEEGVPCNETGEEIPLDDHVIYLLGGGIIIGIVYHRQMDRGELKA